MSDDIFLLDAVAKRQQRIDQWRMDSAYAYGRAELCAARMERAAEAYNAQDKERLHWAFYARSLDQRVEEEQRALTRMLQRERPVAEPAATAVPVQEPASVASKGKRKKE